ncbi:hypothetical protein D9756_007755 [Leucocoprinus leucothites]|uniref:Histone chaperone domain-containing protein n=1 Tax=Leucocoprinus leucothites TaxID=201217 RepID=A0A8H5D281_9AGAR|nr:hypothetical protein D9756_007755 [Leucoagaricus leucothites]
MSSSVTDPASDAKNASAGDNVAVDSPNNKGKGKAPVADEPMDEDENDEEEDNDEDGDEEDEDEVEESFEEIDPSAIVTGGRRTRGVRVDYTSKEALEKAGLKPDDADEDEDDDVDMQH